MWKPISITLLLAVVFNPVHASILYRNWTDREGRVLEARLIRYDNGQATIERADGRKFTFAASLLSETDQDYIREWVEEQARQQQASGVEVYDLNNPFLKDPLTVEKREEISSNMLIYASSLGKARDLVVVKERGLYIRGTTLSGSGVQRPQVYVRRAAELLAEEGLEKQNARLIGDALHQFYSGLRDYNTPVGYLRRGAVQYRQSHPEFAIYCEVELAHCYRMQGDHISAFSILEKYRGRSPDNEMIGRALASYAQALLEHGYYDEALKIAQEVRDKCPIAGLQYGKSAQDIAVNVIAMLPMIDKGGYDPGTKRELQLLTNIESNPRRYLWLGDDAHRMNNYRAAIEYWQQYQKHFPTDESTPPVLLRIGQAWLALKDTEKALQTFENLWKSFPDQKHAWQARLEAAQVCVNMENMKEAMRILQEGESQIKGREGKAQLLAARARYLMRANDADGAAKCFIRLLSEYGDQDAATGVWQELSRQQTIQNIRDWRQFTKAIEDWLVKNGGTAQMGGVELTVTALSDLRRLAVSVR